MPSSGSSRGAVLAAAGVWQHRDLPAQRARLSRLIRGAFDFGRKGCPRKARPSRSKPRPNPPVKNSAGNPRCYADGQCPSWCQEGPGKQTISGDSFRGVTIIPALPLAKACQGVPPYPGQNRFLEEADGLQMRDHENQRKLKQPALLQGRIRGFCREGLCN